MTPSPQQHAVFDVVKNDSCCVQLSARAGTGKTTTLMEILPLLKGSTWFCAFNKSIVSEIEFRVSKRTDIEDGSVRVSTVHSAGMRVWNKHIAPRRNRVDGRKVRSMIDELAKTEEFFKAKSATIGKLVDLAKQSGFGVLCRITDKTQWRDLIEHFGMDLESFLTAEEWDRIIDAAIRVYKRSLVLCESGDIDFSDMLLAPLYYKAKWPQYDNILIDEDQDISPLRLKLILSCLRPGGRVVGVGDPYQAIYGFTGADSDSIETIKQLTKARELPLTVTYRCPQAVVREAKRIVPDIEAHTRNPEGLHITVDLKPASVREGEPKPTGFWDCGPYTENDVVLCRNTKPLVELAYQFLRKQIPCMIEGRDIGQGLVMLITSRWKRCNTIADLEVKLEEFRLAEVAKFKQMNQEYRAEALEDQIDTVLVLCEATASEGGTEIQDVVNLIGRMFGDTPDGSKPKCVTFSTVHKSKGREWQRVFLLGRNRYMPSKFARKPWEKQQEQNLEYVAVTRSMRELIDVVVPMK